MRLYHVSEDPDILVFHPRLPKRDDLDPATGLVWALDEERLPNFLTPRDCPRVAYHVGSRTSAGDRERFFSSSRARHALVLEQKWFDAMRNTRLYLYVFDGDGFELQDSVAGYYVSKCTQVPVARQEVDDLFGALFQRHVELRVVENLWDIADRVRSSSLNWSLCRMGYAQPRV